MIQSDLNAKTTPHNHEDGLQHAGDHQEPKKSPGAGAMCLYPSVEDIREKRVKVRAYATLVFNDPPSLHKREKWFVIRNTDVAELPRQIYSTKPLDRVFRETPTEIEMAAKPGTKHRVYFHSRFLVGLSDEEAEKDKRMIKFFCTQKRKKERSIFRAYSSTVEAFEECHKPWNKCYDTFCDRVLSIKRWQEGYNLFQEQLQKNDFANFVVVAEEGKEDIQPPFPQLEVLPRVTLPEKNRPAKRVTFSSDQEAQEAQPIKEREPEDYMSEEEEEDILFLQGKIIVYQWR